jgi:hypothetical protein
MVGGLANGRLLNSAKVSINGPAPVGQIPVMPGSGRLKENEDHSPAPRPLIEELLKDGHSRIKGLRKPT